MSDTLRAAAQQALEALDEFMADYQSDDGMNSMKHYAKEHHAAITALRAALAEPVAAAVAEPVAWDWLRGVIDGIPTREEYIGGQREKYVSKEAVMGWLHEGQSRAMRAAPPQREPLTDAQIEDCIDASNRAFNIYRSSGPRGQQITTMDDWKYWLARAIDERAHGITKEAP